MGHIAFLGLGKMGAEMATNLLKKGFTLTVYNRTREKTESLRAAGHTPLKRQRKRLRTRMLLSAWFRTT